jgi:hypothetical protein
MGAPRVFALTDLQGAALKIPAGLPPQSNYVLAGHTDNYYIHYQRSLGAAGLATAQSLLARCEADYQKTKGWFNVDPHDVPFQIYVISDINGAMHYGCLDTEIYVGKVTEVKDPSSDTYGLLMMAEVVEVFEATQNKGWNCGYSNGEGLSRVLACELYPEAQTPSLVSVPTWLYKPPLAGAIRDNWVDYTDYIDTNAYSVGCAVLFLNWLRWVRGYSWDVIVAAAGDTLASTYQTLSHADDAWPAFRSDIDARFPPTAPTKVSTDNPFR